MTLHVKFTSDGIPGWISETPAEDSVEVSELTIEFLAAHRWTGKEWVQRDQPPPPTAEELAAREADRLAAEAEAKRIEQEALDHAEGAFEEEVALRAGPDMILRLGNKITVAEFNARMAALRARVAEEWQG